jgi:hypothetical protein
LDWIAGQEEMPFPLTQNTARSPQGLVDTSLQLSKTLMTKTLKALTLNMFEVIEERGGKRE